MDFTHPHVAVYEYFFVCFDGLGTGQLLKDKIQKRNTVQYLTLKDPIMVPDTMRV